MMGGLRIEAFQLVWWKRFFMFPRLPPPLRLVFDYHKKILSKLLHSYVRVGSISVKPFFFFLNKLTGSDTWGFILGRIRVIHRRVRQFLFGDELLWVCHVAKPPYCSPVANYLRHRCLQACPYFWRIIRRVVAGCLNKRQAQNHVLCVVNEVENWTWQNSTTPPPGFRKRG